MLPRFGAHRTVTSKDRDVAPVDADPTLYLELPNNCLVCHIVNGARPPRHRQYLTTATNSRIARRSQMAVTLFHSLVHCHYSQHEHNQ